MLRNAHQFDGSPVSGGGDMTSSNHFDVQHVGCRNAAARRRRPESHYAAECPRSKFGLSTVELTDRHDHPSGHTFSEKASRHSACIIALQCLPSIRRGVVDRISRSSWSPCEVVVTSFDGGTSCRHAFSTRRYCHLGSSSHGGGCSRASKVDWNFGDFVVTGQERQRLPPDSSSHLVGSLSRSS